MANIMCEVDNSQGQLRVRSIVTSLQQDLELRSNCGDVFIHTDVKVRNQFAGVDVGSTAIGNEIRKTGVMLNADGKDGSIIQPTTNGNIVKCKYQLKVNFQ